MCSFELGQTFGLIIIQGGVFKQAESFARPKTGRQIQTYRAWSYEPATQTAVAQTVWEEVGTDGQVTDRWESGPIRLHCVFPFEMEHLLARTGFEIETVYRNFFRETLADESTEMVWVAKRGHDPEIK